MPSAEFYFEIERLISSGEVCKFSSFTRSELGIEVECDNSNDTMLAIVVLLSCALAAFAIANRKKILNFLKPQ